MGQRGSPVPEAYGYRRDILVKAGPRSRSHTRTTTLDRDTERRAARRERSTSDAAKTPGQKTGSGDTVGEAFLRSLEPRLISDSNLVCNLDTRFPSHGHSFTRICRLLAEPMAYLGMSRVGRAFACDCSRSPDMLAHCLVDKRLDSTSA